MYPDLGLVFYVYLPLAVLGALAVFVGGILILRRTLR